MSCRQCERVAEEGEELCIWHSPREGKEFEGLEVRDEMFEDVHLARAKFSNVSFDSCVFVDCDLSEAEFINAEIMNCEFREGKRSLDLSQARFLHKTLIQDSTFARVDLSKSTLDNSRVVDCSIRKSDWSQAVISGSEWEHCSVDSGEFSGSEIRDTRINDSRFRDVDMSRLSLQDCVIESSDFGESDLSHSEFANTNVASTDFRESDLSRALLRQIEAIDCDFSYADISNADLSGSNLENSKFVGSDLSGTKLQDTLLYNAVFQYSGLKGAFLDEVVREERTAEKDSGYDSRRGGFERAQAIYRELKDYFHREGYYDHASHYRYREKVCDRKKRRWREVMKHVSLVVDMFYGYGEKPFRLLIWWAVIVFGCAVGFSILGLHTPPDLWAAIQHSFGAFFGLPILGAQESVPIVVLEMAESAIGKVMVVLFAAIVSRKVD